MTLDVALARIERRELEEVPEEWSVVRLGQLYKERKEPGAPGLPVMSVTVDNGLVPRESLDRRVESDLAPREHALARAGDLVYNTMRMWQGASGIAATDCIVSPAYVVAAPKGQIAPEFARYLLKSPRVIAGLFSYSHGITRDRLRLYFENFQEVPIPLPPLPEQQKIAAILSSVDDAIAVTRKVIEQTKPVKQGLLQTLMTRGIGHTRFKKTEIGEIPEGWELSAALGVALGGDDGIAGGPFGSDLTSKDYVTEAGVPVIRGANLNYSRGTFRSEGFVYVSSEKADRLARNLAYPGDLIITQRGSLGQVGLIPDDTDHDRYVVSQSQMKLTPDGGKARARYLWYYLSSEVALRWIELHTIATGVPHINLGLFRRLPIPVPSLSEQDAILAQLDNVQGGIDSSFCELERLERVKKGLLQDLLTGRVRVPLD